MIRGVPEVRDPCAQALVVVQEKPYNEVMDAAAALTENEVRTALAVLAERLRSLLGSSLARLVLYGSRARGDADPDSDIDVAVIVRDAGPRERDRIFEAVADVELETGVPLSTLILSEPDYNHLLKRERRLALDIEKEGIEL
jgi:predicted nucleotidyltransferase